MTQVIDDVDTFEGSLNDTNATTLSVDTRNADSVALFVDDGTQDGTPASFDLTTRVRAPEFSGDPFMFYADETGVTFRSVEDPAYGPEMQYEITNQSGASADYRVRLVSLEDGA